MKATKFTLGSCWLARVAMPKPYSEYTKQLIVFHHRQGLKTGDISQILMEEGSTVSRQGTAKFLVKFIESGSVTRKPGRGRPLKVTAEVWKFIKEAMRKNDKMTGKELQRQLPYPHAGITCQRTQYLMYRTGRGWIFRGTFY